MEIYNDNELTLRLKNNTVSQEEKLHYFLALIAFGFVVSSSLVHSWTCNKANIWDYWVDVISLAIAIFGVFYCYKTNSKGDGKDFIERCLCIGFPVGVQSVCLKIALNMLCMFVAGILLKGGMPHQSTVVNLLIQAIVITYFFLRLNSQIASIAR